MKKCRLRGLQVEVIESGLLRTLGVRNCCSDMIVPASRAVGFEFVISIRHGMNCNFWEK